MHRTHTALELFDEWNTEKQILHNVPLSEEIFINPRDVWYIKMWMNIGNEQNGKGEFLRPALVIRRIWNMYFWKIEPDEFYRIKKSLKKIYFWGG